MSVPFRTELEGIPGGIVLVRILNMIIDESQTSPLILSGTRIRNGNGSPEGAVNGSVGDMYLRKDGGTNTTLYVKESGTGLTGWSPK